MIETCRIGNVRIPEVSLEVSQQTSQKNIYLGLGSHRDTLSQVLMNTSSNSCWQNLSVKVKNLCKSFWKGFFNIITLKFLRKKEPQPLAQNQQNTQAQQTENFRRTKLVQTAFVNEHEAAQVQEEEAVQVQREPVAQVQEEEAAQVQREPVAQAQQLQAEVEGQEVQNQVPVREVLSGQPQRPTSRAPDNDLIGRRVNVDREDTTTPRKKRLKRSLGKNLLAQTMRRPLGNGKRKPPSRSTIRGSSIQSNPTSGCW